MTADPATSKPVRPEVTEAWLAENRGPARGPAKLVGMRKEVSNQLRNLLKVFGHVIGAASGQVFDARVRDLAASDAILSITAEALLAARTALAEQVARLDKLLREWNRPGGYRPAPHPASLVLSVQGRMMVAARWTIWVEVARPDGTSERHEVGSVQRSLSSANPDDLGLRLAEAKEFLHEAQL